ncbi:YicC/YloC family endoribonuclease [Paucibacter sp. APW11]|uniref:YicC/YloC family endoribonuclease n=1 Tax=Roseateles aquae TaxID=3077235 RepID=A0ABU3P770_9BURK|nr:YicC/YloC family endoribonuclease [Paucibacter sp. APW11]MDT8998406.1 YicC/YloC family endoribonuclease [Paucibacter sp. APW11]
MPVYSMTGYASASSQPVQEGETSTVTGTSVTVEARSVNGRFLDLSMRMPEDLRGLEPALRELVSATVKRGKIELRINTQRESESAWPQPQPEQLNRLARLESTIQGWLPKAAPLSVQEVLQWCKSGGTTEKLDEATLDAARRCIAGLAEAREREGEKLVAILLERVATLRSLADQAEPLLPQVVQRQQQRFLERWQEALASSGAANTVSEEALRERALNEAAAYAIRIDVAEELARLRAHLDEITRLLKKGGELGKRLDFLIQELHREANTLGSKSSALDLTNISVEMKVAIEQLREQVQNIE